MQFMAHESEVWKWLLQHYSMRLHELLNAPTEALPELTVLVNNTNTPASMVQFLGDDKNLIVFVAVSSQYYGAVLERQNDWWLPVAPPREVSDEAFGLSDPIAQAKILNYLLHQE